MDPGTVLRKTAKGLEEMSNRTYRLPQRSRSVLIVVDGRLTRAAVLQRTVDPLESGRVLDDLLAQGFIEVSHTSPDAAARPAPGDGAHAIDLAATRRAAASAVLEALGPDGEMLAMQIEKCRTVDDLLELIDRSHDIVRNVRGTKAAESFAQRCGFAA